MQAWLILPESRSSHAWDGEPVSQERPHGATVVGASSAPDGWRYLLLHRVHHGGPAREGVWAWTPPSGSRKPGEDLSVCVARELQQEVGWRASQKPVLTEAVGWAVFAWRSLGHGSRAGWGGTRQVRVSEFWPRQAVLPARGAGGVFPGRVRNPVRPALR